MGIDVIIVQEDLTTLVEVIGSLDEDELRDAKKIAREKELVFIAGIGRWCDTVINMSQREMLAKEISKIKECDDVNRDIITMLETAIQVAGANTGQYIKFIGE